MRDTGQVWKVDVAGVNKGLLGDVGAGMLPALHCDVLSITGVAP
jgi:hypothetical protein